MSVDGDFETVAIDWAYVGIASIGMDIAVPLILSILFSQVETESAVDFSRQLYQGYLEGLRESGFTEDERLVRLGYVASSACKFFELLMFYAILRFADLDRIREFETREGRPSGSMHRAFAVLVSIVFQYADEARSLMDELGY